MASEEQNLVRASRGGGGGWGVGGVVWHRSPRRALVGHTSSIARMQSTTLAALSIAALARAAASTSRDAVNRPMRCPDPKHGRTCSPLWMAARNGTMRPAAHDTRTTRGCRDSRLLLAAGPRLLGRGPRLRRQAELVGYLSCGVRWVGFWCF